MSAPKKLAAIKTKAAPRVQEPTTRRFDRLPVRLPNVNYAPRDRRLQVMSWLTTSQQCGEQT